MAVVSAAFNFSLWVYRRFVTESAKPPVTIFSLYPVPHSVLFFVGAGAAVTSIVLFCSGYRVYALNLATFSSLSGTVRVSLDQMTPELTVPGNVLGWLVVQTECPRVFRTTEGVEIELRSCRRSCDSSLSCWECTPCLSEPRWRQGVGSCDVRRQPFAVCLRVLSFSTAVRTRRNGSFCRGDVSLIPDWYMGASLAFVGLGSMAYWTI